jgi:hypothetical protein
MEHLASSFNAAECVFPSVVSCVVMSVLLPVGLVPFYIWWIGPVCCYLVFNSCNVSKIILYVYINICIIHV